MREKNEEVMGLFEVGLPITVVPSPASAGDILWGGVRLKCWAKWLSGDSWCQKAYNNSNCGSILWPL